MGDPTTHGRGQRAIEAARARVLAAGRTGDAPAAEHAARAYVAAVHLGMLRGMARRASAAVAAGARRLAGAARPGLRPRGT